MNFGDFIDKHGTPTLIIVFLMWFVAAKLWPWYSKEAWPTMVRRESMRDNLMQTVRDALVEMKVLTEQVVRRTDVLMTIMSRFDSPEAIQKDHVRGEEYAKAADASSTQTAKAVGEDTPKAGIVVNAGSQVGTPVNTLGGIIGPPAPG